jgi:hypothetical protein
MLPLDLSKNFKHKFFFSDHMPIHVLALGGNFSQIFEANVDCVIVDPIEIEANFKSSKK